MVTVGLSKDYSRPFTDLGNYFSPVTKEVLQKGWTKVSVDLCRPRSLKDKGYCYCTFLFACEFGRCHVSVNKVTKKC